MKSDKRNEHLHSCPLLWLAINCPIGSCANNWSEPINVNCITSWRVSHWMPSSQSADIRPPWRTDCATRRAMSGPLRPINTCFYQWGSITFYTTLLGVEIGMHLLIQKALASLIGSVMNMDVTLYNALEPYKLVDLRTNLPVCQS